VRLFGRQVDKPTAAVLAAVLASAVLFVSMLGLLSSAKGKLSSLESARAEMRELGAEYAALGLKVGALEKKRGLTRIKGIVEAVDGVFEPLGLKEKVESVKPIGSDDPLEERAEVTVEGVSMNEMVNFLYSIENSPMLLLIRKIEVKTSYMKPERLNITLTLTFLKPE
jgi:hypothetical protein